MRKSEEEMWKKAQVEFTITVNGETTKHVGYDMNRLHRAQPWYRRLALWWRRSFIGGWVWFIFSLPRQTFTAIRMMRAEFKKPPEERWK